MKNLKKINFWKIDRIKFCKNYKKVKVLNVEEKNWKIVKKLNFETFRGKKLEKLWK